MVYEQENKTELEGYRSFWLNKGEYKNPYKLSSTLYNLFERGWSQAVKRTPETAAQELSKQRIREKTFINQEEHRKRRVDADAYRKRKG
jgi:hypothetical protein